MLIGCLANLDLQVGTSTWTSSQRGFSFGFCADTPGNTFIWGLYEEWSLYFKNLLASLASKNTSRPPSLQITAESEATGR